MVSSDFKEEDNNRGNGLIKSVVSNFYNTIYHLLLIWTFTYEMPEEALKSGGGAAMLGSLILLVIRFYTSNYFVVYWKYSNF